MKIASLALMSALLAGCSTLQGQPSPIVDMKTAIDIIKTEYTPSEVVPTYNGQHCVPNAAGTNVDKSSTERCIWTVRERRTYRDEVLFTYMRAVNSRYDNFISATSSQRKFGNGLLSVLSLYTSALASVSTGGLSTGFSASSTFLQGSQGKLNEDLFYKQTLPALINLMDAERTRVRTDILTKLASDNDPNAIEYGLPEALVDIDRYEDAASVERAVAKLAQQAAQALTQAESDEKDARDKRAGFSPEAMEDRPSVAQPPPDSTTSSTPPTGPP